MDALSKGMKQGVDILPLGEDGRGIRVSNNVPWYQEYYKEHGKAPNQAQLRDLAYLLTVGDASAPNVEGWIPTTREAAEAMDAARGELDELNGHIQTLENIKERMMKVDSFEVKGSAGLSPEGYKLYRQIIEMLEKIGDEQKEDKQTKVARMNAMLFAHHADIFAAAMRTQEGKEKYTALDYFEQKFGLRDGGRYAPDAAALHQAMNADVNLDEQVPIVDITAALPQKKMSNKDVLNFIRGLVQKNDTITSADGKAVFSILPKDVRHITFSSNKKANAAEFRTRKASVVSIENLLENAVLIESTPNRKTSKKPNVRAYHRFYVPVQMNGKLYTIRIVAEEQNGAITIEPTDVNLYDVIVEKKTSRTPAGISPVMGSAGNLTTISIRDMLSGVKDADGNVYAQSAWHGTPHDFDGFDLGGIGTDANIYHQKDSLDNDMADSDNESRISDAVFQKYLNDGIMEMVRDRVSAEIGEYVDLSVMSDPVERDSARDSLPSIKKMLVWYNQNIVQDNEAYKNRLAVRIEYARRCFDLDERIQERSRSARTTDGDNRSGGIDQNRNDAVSVNDARRGGESNRRSPRGVSRSVSGERSGARAHFEKLYNDMQKHLESQGAFSMLKQMLRQEVRGEISQEDGKRVITLFESADESTFMHEMGHMFLISRSLSYFINLL
ncbi:hypothetical protein [Selenomonas flueggei]|uniref:LPD3 domain-containing protein n=1 Tax=Selenomonas flueggei TaxID=135080 RepID=UPI0026736F94|nr:hypothetical protein [Selenomonas flueggei]